ncbi:hypothetical protein JHW43_008507 [Diplocarpon mali]|nr:hypothetical protein JHW43_008507 [Diplocarpon mali]
MADDVYVAQLRKLARTITLCEPLREVVYRGVHHSIHARREPVLSSSDDLGAIQAERSRFTKDDTPLPTIDELVEKREIRSRSAVGTSAEREGLAYSLLDKPNRPGTRRRFQFPLLVPRSRPYPLTKLKQEFLGKIGDVRNISGTGVLVDALAQLRKFRWVRRAGTGTASPLVFEHPSTPYNKVANSSRTSKLIAQDGA